MLTGNQLCKAGEPRSLWVGSRFVGVLSALRHADFQPACSDRGFLHFCGCTVEDNRGRAGKLREQYPAGCNSRTTGQRAEGAGWGAHGRFVAERNRETGVAHPSYT